MQYWVHNAQNYVDPTNRKTKKTIIGGSLIPIIIIIWKPNRNAVIESEPWSNSIPSGEEVSKHKKPITCASCLFPIDVIQRLINKDGDTHHIVFPVRHAFRVISNEHKYQMNYDQNQKCWQGDNIGCHPSREKCKHQFSQWRPYMCVCDTCCPTFV